MPTLGSGNQSCAPTPCKIPGGVWCHNRTAARQDAEKTDDDDDGDKREWESLFDDDDDHFLNMFKERTGNTCEDDLLWRVPGARDVASEDTVSSSVVFGQILMLPVVLMYAKRLLCHLLGNPCSESSILLGAQKHGAAGA